MYINLKSKLHFPCYLSPCIFPSVIYITDIPYFNQCNCIPSLLITIRVHCMHALKFLILGISVVPFSFFSFLLLFKTTVW